MICRMSRMGARHMGGYHIGLVLGHFGLCWDILGHVGTILGSSWAILGSFRICVGLCFGLGHVSVVEFSPMQGVCKKHQKYQEKIQFVDYVADGFCFYFFGCFCFFLQACCNWAFFKGILAILGYFGICVGLCLGFGHSSVVEISSMQGVCKKKHKYQEQTQF